jgi:hypothetical protein
VARAPQEPAAGRNGLRSGVSRTWAIQPIQSGVEREAAREPAPRRGLWAVGLVLLALTAAWARVTILPQVFLGGRVLPRYPDALYHLRQIERASESFPRVPVLDPGLNWPLGGFSVWAPGFDWLGALLVLATGQAGDPAAAARVASFLPVAFGVATALAVVGLTRLLLPGPERDRVALAAGLLWALLPDSIQTSRLGNVDHHAAECLCMLALGAWVLWAAAESPGSPRTRRAWWLFEAAGGLVALGAGLLFSGAVLYVGIAAALLAILRLASDAAPRHWGVLAGSGAPALALAGLALAALSVPGIEERGHALDFRFPSYLQPLLYGAAALACAVAAGFSRAFEAARRPAVRFALRAAGAAGVLLLLGALGAAALASVGAEVVAGLSQFLGRRDPWLAGILEFQPLFPSAELWRPEAWIPARVRFGLPGLLAPLLLALGLARALRERPRTGALFALWTLAIGVLALRELRFGALFGVNLALASALALDALAAALAGALQSRFRAGAPLRAAALALLALAVSLGEPAVRRALVWHPPRPLSALEDVSLRLREIAGGAPVHGGVLAPWDYGHTLLALSGQPVVSAGFGPYVGPEGFAEVRRFPREGPAELEALLERRRLAWVVAGSPVFLWRDGELQPLYRRDAEGRERLDWQGLRGIGLAGAILGGSGNAREGIGHLEHLRPRYASARRVAGLAEPVFLLWLYERVPGARLSGRAAPGARVVAQTALRVHGVRLPYQAWTRADAGGRFELVLPLPNGESEPGFETASDYAVEAEGQPLGRAIVTAEAVTRGEVLELSSEPRLASVSSPSAPAAP